jgi:tripeptide aminopeptidase
MNIPREQLVNRFLNYVRIDTQSDPESSNTPSTNKQWKLAELLAEELKSIGLSDVKLDEKAYLTATLPSNSSKELPVIGFISHFDTSPDFKGANVNPRIVENYDGEAILLNPELQIELSPKDFPELLDYVQQDLIVTDGTTLLGADDKAGIAEIMTAMAYLLEHPEIPHGTIRIGFTPDEEIGRGAHHFDVKGFGAQWAYTIDGSQIGELEYQNFNAAKAKIQVWGKGVHPGYAKDKMINALTVIRDLLSGLPENEVPEKTSGREGFFHIHHLSGSVDQATAELIIRDHDRELFEGRKELLEQLVSNTRASFKTKIECQIEDQYYNMEEKVLPVFSIVTLAERAMTQVGVKPIIKPIRGGTDGSQLSFMGLPCPNIFAGGHNFHGKYEFIPIQSMIKATEVIVKICELAANEPIQTSN